MAEAGSQTPKPTTRGGAGRGGAAGGGRSLRPLSGRPRRTPGVRPGPGPARRQPSPWPGGRAPAPCWGGRPSRAAQGVQAARLPGIEATLFPHGPCRGQHPVALPACSPGARGQPHPSSRETSEGAHPDRRPGGCAVATQSPGRGLGLALCLTSHLTLHKPPRLAQPQFPHLCEGQGEWLTTTRAAVMTTESAHGVLSLPPPGAQAGRGRKGPDTSPRPLRPSPTLSFTKVNPHHHRGEGDHVVLQRSDPSQ